MKIIIIKILLSLFKIQILIKIVIIIVIIKIIRFLVRENKKGVLLVWIKRVNSNKVLLVLEKINLRWFLLVKIVKIV